MVGLIIIALGVITYGINKLFQKVSEIKFDDSEEEGL